jgi:hypothetical protein
MESKFSTYELLGYLLPGSMVVLIICNSLAIYQPDLLQVFGQETLAATAFLVASFVAGHFMQALSSGITERFLYWLSGGRPSDRLCKKGLAGMKKGRWTQAKRSILLGLGFAKSLDEADAYEDDEAIKVCFKSSRKLGECERFNGLYALNRALLASLLISLVVVVVLTWSNWSDHKNLWPLVITVFLFLVQLNRYRQRGEYLVIEVVSQTEILAKEKLTSRVGG